MKINARHHLAYCTNIHRGEDWPQTFQTLKDYALRVKERVCPNRSYAIGLRLSAQAAAQLAEARALLEFQRWLDANDCYIFTVNGFPYGAFHGQRVKENVYRPDWTTRERVDYTKRLFRLLEKLTPDAMEGSVSTVPCSFKPFIQSADQERIMRDHLWECVEFLQDLSDKSGKAFHLGLEPEPMCYLETSEETAEFFQRMREDRPQDDRILRHLGVNYDACHLGVEFERASDAMDRFLFNQVKISKIHLSSALTVKPTQARCEALAAFQEDVYLHQVVARQADGTFRRYADLPEALEQRRKNKEYEESEEWRIHFHIPLHAEPTDLYANTTGHIMELLDILKERPNLCSHFEMETYTWEVLPESLKRKNVVDQLEMEYRWTLNEFSRRGMLNL